MRDCGGDAERRKRKWRVGSSVGDGIKLGTSCFQTSNLFFAVFASRRGTTVFGGPLKKGGNNVVPLTLSDYFSPALRENVQVPPFRKSILILFPARDAHWKRDRECGEEKSPIQLLICKGIQNSREWNAEHRDLSTDCLFTLAALSFLVPARFPDLAGGNA